MPAEQPFTGVLLHGSTTAEYLRRDAASLSEMPVEGTIVEEVTRSLTPVSVNDCRVSLLTKDDAEKLDEQNIRALLLAPIVFNNQVNGLILVHQDAPRQWNAMDLSLLVRAADAVAIGLKYLTLASGAEYLAERATAYRYSLRRIYSILETESVLSETVRSARMIFNVDQACVFEFDSALNCIEESCADEYPGPLTIRRTLEIADNPLVEQPVGTPAVLNFVGADLSPALTLDLARLKVKSAMAVKLMNGDLSLLLSIHQCDKPRRWTAEEISIFRDLAHNTQTALDASRSISDSKRLTVSAPIETNENEQQVPQAISADPRNGNGALSAEDLSRLNKDLEEIIYTASHDMRSPLLSIDGYLSNLERELIGSPSPRTAQYLERIRANTGLLQKLINSLLDVSRLRGQTDISQVVKCSEIVSAIKYELQPRLEQIGGEINIQSDLPTINGSRLQLTRAFSNLINNAINYRDSSRPLKITVGHHDHPEEVELYVADNGLGIKRADFEKIFQPLTRLEVNKSEGTGMGLYIVKQIVSNHGGNVRVESQEGIGTTFFITLPHHATNGSTRFKRAVPQKAAH